MIIYNGFAIDEKDYLLILYLERIWMVKMFYNSINCYFGDLG